MKVFMDRGIDFIIRKTLFDEYDIDLNNSKTLSENSEATKYAKDAILKVQKSTDNFEDIWYAICSKCDHPDNPVKDMIGEDMIPYLKSIYGDKIAEIILEF
jgi:hypothetical protein